MRRIAIIGSTGSVGRQTVDVVRSFPEEFQVFGLSAWNSQRLMMEQAQEFQTPLLYCRPGYEMETVPAGSRVVDSLEEIVTHPDVDMVVMAVVGSVGLVPVLQALRAGKQVAIANKEPLVMAGELITDTMREYGGALLPVDSEPSAIWQCLRGEDGHKDVEKLVITASGGALRDTPLEDIASITPEAALRHPTWSMGRKITIDSATLMNKAFEVIEAHWLFSVAWDRIKVVLHPQSIVHSMVEFTDGSIKAQMSLPDMRLPIQYALFYPRRCPNSTLPRFDPTSPHSLTFHALDYARYPCFAMALDASISGGTYPTVLSAADEVVVDLFLNHHIGFLDMQELVARVLEQHTPVVSPTLEDILVAEAWAREAVTREAKVRT